VKRRNLLAGCASLAALGAPRAAPAQTLTSLDVAYAGSMGSLMEGPIKAGAAQMLQVAMHGRGQGSDALAKLIVGGSITPDVFVSVTPGPMLAVLHAGKARSATPIARTEMVIAYSPTGAYAQQFVDAVARKRGAPPWWRVLQQPGLRFGRTDPVADPQGRNIIFSVQLAEAYYRDRGLAQRILGPTINQAQIFSEATVQARLQSGELDAASAYRIQPGAFDLPYIRLPDEINLGNAALREHYRSTSLEVDGKTFQPEPLVYYAAALADAAQRDRAFAFVRWLARDAQPLFKNASYDSPAGASPLT